MGLTNSRGKVIAWRDETRRHLLATADQPEQLLVPDAAENVVAAHTGSAALCSEDRMGRVACGRYRPGKY